jgi:hypothetical protein
MKNNTMEEDLILGEGENEETGTWDEVLELRSHSRSDIDTAIAAYQFLSELDVDGPDVLRWGIKRKLMQAKKRCLIILCDSLAGLEVEPVKEEIEED